MEMDHLSLKLLPIRWHINYVKSPSTVWRKSHDPRLEQVRVKHQTEAFSNRAVRSDDFPFWIFSSTQSCAPLQDASRKFFFVSFMLLFPRAIPQAGYIKLGALRYGIRISNLNLSDYPQSNKPPALSTSTPSPLIMSPSSETISANAICDDRCCCCIGSASSKTRLPMSQSGEKKAFRLLQIMKEKKLTLRFG